MEWVLSWYFSRLKIAIIHKSCLSCLANGVPEGQIGHRMAKVLKRESWEVPIERTGMGTNLVGLIKISPRSRSAGIAAVRFFGGMDALPMPVRSTFPSNAAHGSIALA